MKLLIAQTILACFTQSDINTAKCDSLCRRDGYSAGYFSNNNCNCIDKKASLNEFINRSVKIGPHPVAPSRKPNETTGKIWLSNLYGTQESQNNEEPE